MTNEEKIAYACINLRDELVAYLKQNPGDLPLSVMNLAINAVMVLALDRERLIKLCEAITSLVDKNRPQQKRIH